MKAEHFVVKGYAILLCFGLLWLTAARAAETGEKNANAASEHEARQASAPRTPYERLSSGGLMLLDRDGDLVQAPARREATSGNNPAGTLVRLDSRVGANIRLGDDPPALPPTMRAQAEPHIARSLIEPDFLVATFQEGRFTSGGAVDCGYSISRDGGLTWSRALIPWLSLASGGPYFRATDPVAGISWNGNIYLNTLAAMDSTFSHGEVVVSRSTDGGTTFDPPSLVYAADPDTTNFPDKNWMAINTSPGTATAGRIVVTFSLFPDPNADGAPILRVFSGDGGVTWSSDHWHPPGDDRESLQTLAPGGYTAVLRGKNDSTGVALVEMYDLGPVGNSKLGNISTRGLVQTVDNVMIGGFIVGGGLGTNGSGSAKVVTRGLGPSLTQSGVPGALQDPVLELHNSNGTGVAANDDWRQNQVAELQVLGLAPTDDRESAIVRRQLHRGFAREERLDRRWTRRSLSGGVKVRQPGELT